MPWTASIARLLLAAVISVAAAFLQVIGLILLAYSMLWFACVLVMIGVAVAAGANGYWRPIPFDPALDPWIYTGMGELGVLCILLSRRVESWLQPRLGFRSLVETRKRR